MLHGMIIMSEKLGLYSLSYLKTTKKVVGGKAMDVVSPLVNESEHANVDVMSRVRPTLI